MDLDEALMWQSQSDNSHFRHHHTELIILLGIAITVFIVAIYLKCILIVGVEFSLQGQKGEPGDITDVSIQKIVLDWIKKKCLLNIFCCQGLK